MEIIALSAWEVVPSGALTRPELRSWLSASDREMPVLTRVNGTLMGRRGNLGQVIFRVSSDQGAGR